MEGDTVRIYGRNSMPNHGDNQVRFGGVLATTSAGNSYYLVSQVPAGAVTGPITVTNPAGAGASARLLEQCRVGESCGDHVVLVDRLAHLLNLEEVGQLVEPVEDELQHVDHVLSVLVLVVDERLEADHLRRRLGENQLGEGAGRVLIRATRG